jgi:hypothetical protein
MITGDDTRGFIDPGTDDPWFIDRGLIAPDREISD